jgi:PAS domain S-box-containing protein
MKSINQTSRLSSQEGASMAGVVTRRRTEGNGIARQESHWKDIVYASAPLACLNFDQQGRIVDLNVAAARMLGSGSGGEPGRPLADYVSRRHWPRLTRHIQQSEGAKSAVVTRVQLRGKEGDVEEVEMSTCPADDAICYRTQLHRVAPGSVQEWPSGDAKFRALVENGDEVVCVGAPDGTIFYTSPSVKRVLGYEVASWFGRNAFEIMHPEDAEAAKAGLRALASTPTGTITQMVSRVRHADGTWRWAAATLTNLIGEPDVGGIVCNYRDVTEARHTEETLRSSEQRYRLVAESLPNLICVRDVRGRLLYCNSHWCQYRGVTITDAQKLEWTAGIPKEDFANLTPPPWVTGEEGPWDGECRIRRADGEFRWHVVRIIPLAEVPGSAARWLAFATDIHARKQIEQERERLLAQIERESSDLAVQHATLRVLANGQSIEGVAPQLIGGYCTQLGWSAGALWHSQASEGGRTMKLLYAGSYGGAKSFSLKGAAHITCRIGQGLPGRAWAQRKVVWMQGLSTARGPAHHRAAAAKGMHQAIAFPIVLAGEVRGVIEFFRHQPQKPEQRLIEVLMAAGIQVGLFVQRTDALDRLRRSEEALIQVNNALEHRVRERTAELHEANRDLSSEIAERARLEGEIIRISEREKRRIGQDLHDGVCQELAALAFMIGALGTRMERNGIGESDRVKQVALLLNESIGQVRDIARGLHPVEMDAEGLMVALKDLANQTSETIPCAFKCAQPVEMPESDTALNLYRIAQEAVTNAVKHSGAKRITIALERTSEGVKLSVSDNGSGLPSGRGGRTRIGIGMGLNIMRYRARSAGAALKLENRKPHGTKILCVLPRK